MCVVVSGSEKLTLRANITEFVRLRESDGAKQSTKLRTEKRKATKQSRRLVVGNLWLSSGAEANGIEKFMFIPFTLDLPALQSRALSFNFRLLS